MLPASLQVLLLVFILQIAVSRRVQAEDNLDIKVMQYQESAGRIGVFSPTFLYKKEFSPDFSIQIDGIYNSISGATPTGAPPVPVYVTTVATTAGSTASTGSSSTPSVRPSSSFGDGEREDEGGDRSVINGRNGSARYIALAGATTQTSSTTASSTGSTTASSTGSGSSQGTTTTTKTLAGTTIPTQNMADKRYGLNFDLTRRIGHNTLSAKLSVSTEQDYQSTGIALSDSIDMNQRNTILSAGLAYTYDVIDILADNTKETKHSEDLIVGITQFISTKTIFTCNLSAGFVNGYLTDPYKVVELNGQLVSEKRPESKTKGILYLGLTHHVDMLNGTAEASYRFYKDSFGIAGQTLTFNWYQELGQYFILRPALRFYDQSESSFYDVRFTGTPEFFSSDYRVSALNAYAYGLKLIWFPSKRFAFDIAYDRYEQSGKDGKTDSGMYPSANIFTAGGRIWF